MKQVVFEHIFECDEDTFWDKLFFEDDYNRKMFLDTLKFDQWEQTIHERTDAVLKRTVVVRPPVGDVPGTIRKILGDKFGYKEHGTFDRKAKRYHVEIEPTAAPDKTHIHGDIWLEKAGDKRVKRIAKMHVEVSIMLVGKLIEDKVVSDMRLSYEKAAGFSNTWMKEKGL
jgi:hypothetical protein